MVYVTHDQAEALTMSDRIAVFHRGRIQQLDTPEQMYEYPKNAFVARFIGENNRLDGVLEAAADGRCTIRLAAGDARIDGTLVEPVAHRRRGHRVAAAGAGANPRGRAYNRRRIPAAAWRGRCGRSSIWAITSRARVALTGNEEFMVKRPISEAHALPRIGAAVEVFWAPEHCRAFAQES